MNVKSNLYYKALSMSTNRFYNITSGLTMFVMVGLPGSGKSHLAKELAKQHNAKIFSTDDFWYLDNPNVYAFDFSRIKEAHAWNRERLETEMRLGKRNVIVDNTNLKFDFRVPFYQLAVEYGYRVRHAVPSTWWAFEVDECVSRNSHGVSLEIMTMMYEGLELPANCGMV